MSFGCFKITVVSEELFFLGVVFLLDVLPGFVLLLFVVEGVDDVDGVDGFDARVVGGLGGLFTSQSVDCRNSPNVELFSNVLKIESITVLLEVKTHIRKLLNFLFLFESLIDDIGKNVLLIIVEDNLYR